MRVLYVEDDQTNRRVMKAILGAMHADMAEAIDGQSGIDAILANDYDLVLMDLRMPGMDGLTAIRHIRALESHHAKLPIIVITADTAPTMRADCMAGGADDVLYKPVSVKELFAVIGRVMASRSPALAKVV